MSPSVRACEVQVSNYMQYSTLCIHIQMDNIRTYICGKQFQCRNVTLHVALRKHLFKIYNENMIYNFSKSSRNESNSEAVLWQRYWFNKSWNYFCIFSFAITRGYSVWFHDLRSFRDHICECLLTAREAACDRVCIHNNPERSRCSAYILLPSNVEDIVILICWRFNALIKTYCMIFLLYFMKLLKKLDI